MEVFPKERPVSEVARVVARQISGRVCVCGNAVEMPLASTLKDEVSTSSSHQNVNYGPGTLPQRWSNLVSKGKVIGDSLPPTGASGPQPVVGASKPLKISAKDIEANISGNIYQPCERESVAESMAGKISKIIETRDRDAVPSAGLVSRDVDDETPKGANGSRIPAVDAEIIETRDRDAVPSAGLVSRDVDDETPKGANGSRIPAVDAETKVTNRAAKNDLEAGTMARAGRTSRGTSSSNTSMDNRGGSNPADWGASQTSVPDITLRSSVAVDSTEGSKPANARASLTSMPDVSPTDSASLDTKEEVNSDDFRRHLAISVTRQDLQTCKYVCQG